MPGLKLSELQRASSSKKGVESAPRWSEWFEFMNRDISLFNGLSDSLKESFYHESAILLKAGVDLKGSLELYIDQQKKPKLISLFSKLRDDLVSGRALSVAMQAHKGFSPYEYFSIQIGEETGQLGDVMSDLAVYYKKRLAQRRQITSALIYPVIVTLTSLGAVFFMMNFVVPMFADIFQRSGESLPGITKVILQVSELTRQYALLTFAVFLALIVYLYTQRRSKWFRAYASKIMLAVPVFGTMIRKVYIARFCNSMALLTGARVPLLRAIQLCRQMVGFYPIEVTLYPIEQEILAGKSLNASLSAYPIYDLKLISLIKVGEEVNQLSEFFEKIAAQYNDDVEHQSAMLSSVLEPLIIIFLGLFVGFILIAMYLPLFQLGSSFQ